MMSKFSILQKIKTNREELALRSLREKRTQFLEAVEHRLTRQKAFEESAASLTERENSVFDKIMQKVVETRDVDTVKESILHIKKEHQQLEDDLELAERQCNLLEKEFEMARYAFLASQRTREKYDAMMLKFMAERTIVLERGEEAEAEELPMSGRPRGA